MGKMKTQEQFLADVSKHLGGDYEVLGQYAGRDVSVEMRHFVCGNTFMKRPHDIISKNNVLLIRIPYYHYTEIPEILFRVLEEKSSTTIEKFCIK